MGRVMRGYGREQQRSSTDGKSGEEPEKVEVIVEKWERNGVQPSGKGRC